MGLEYRYIGGKDEVTFVAFSDASFGCRTDLSSQGGFILLMVNHTVADSSAGASIQGHYNVIDWRSWKLARVARSTLSAESQAASEAADAMLFASTFWNLLWKPWLPLDSLTTARCQHNPKLVIDAKALYDLLARPQVQASSNSDKRTLIEALMTKDKLSCTRATTSWVSSENQWADGLTKQSASQLLANRLRTHMISLTSDENFKAAKKKTPLERKRNMDMFAKERPQRAWATALMSVMTMPTLAAASSSSDIHTTNYHYIDFNVSYLEILTTVLVAFVIGMYVYHGRWVTRYFGSPTRAEVESLEEVSTPAPRPSGPSSADPREDLFPTDPGDIVGSLQNRLLFIEEHYDREKNELDRQHHEELQRLRDQHRAEVSRLTQAPVFYTHRGRCWHANPRCLERSARQTIFSKDYCTLCSHLLGSPIEGMDL